jgi:hypothetical protein
MSDNHLGFLESVFDESGLSVDEPMDWKALGKRVF